MQYASEDELIDSLTAESIRKAEEAKLRAEKGLPPLDPARPFVLGPMDGRTGGYDDDDEEGGDFDDYGGEGGDDLGDVIE